MPRAPVQYAITADGLEIAYQVLGDGPLDVVLVPGLFSNIDHNALSPFYGGYLRRLPRFARTIVLDRRGGGISDRDVGSGSPEDRMDDIRAVMDAVGSGSAALLGQIEGGALALLFAATYPQRVNTLVLVETPAYGPGAGSQWTEVALAHFRKTWGTGRALFQSSRDAPDEASALEVLAALERSIGTPRAITRQFEYLAGLNAQSAMSLVDVPALVLHSPSSIFPVEVVRRTAETLRQARYVEVEGYGSWDHATQDTFIDVIEEFLTGQRPVVTDLDRVLATVLFTDIVDSTRRAAELGDRRWRTLLDAHDAGAAAEVERFRGRLVKHIGDGVLATFDGPARAVRCAQAMIAAARGLGFEIRAGLHTGEIDVRGGDVSGIAVHIGARIGALAGAGEVVVSSTVRDLVVGSGLQFTERGEHELRGIEGRWRLLAVKE